MRGAWLAVLLLVACGDDEGDTTGDDRVADVLALTGSASAGATVYTDTCAVCHGANGEGGAGSALATVADSLSDEEVVDTILNGTSGMVAYDGQLTDQQIADVFAYLRETF